MFNKDKFISHAGLKLDWKIECDDLSGDDWEGLAFMASQVLPKFGTVEGVPTGGLKFAQALNQYKTKGPLLIADDVFTTGWSMFEHKNERDAIGVVVFARQIPKQWITPLFQFRI